MGPAGNLQARKVEWGQWKYNENYTNAHLSAGAIGRTGEMFGTRPWLSLFGLIVCFFLLQVSLVGFSARRKSAPGGV